MTKKIVLTGIKPTGEPHLGNWVGAIKPAIELAKLSDHQAFYFIADYHALTGMKNATDLRHFTYSVAAAWIALGLDPQQVVLYRQSDIPEVFELNWILACFSPKGLMNRAHAYKAQVQRNQELGVDDIDSGINMGLYTYPILMAADILIMRAKWVPVGRDQQQHVEIARDLAQSFNHQYGTPMFPLPDALIDEGGAVMTGLDGRKMSKSYGNTIPLFGSAEELRKLVFRIATDSSRPGEAKNPDLSTIFQIYRQVANDQQVEAMRQAYLQGIGWKDAKQALVDVLEESLRGPREHYTKLMEHPQELDKIFAQGALRAREVAIQTLADARAAIGIS